MKRFVTHILPVYIVAVLFLAATGGVAVFQHVCSSCHAGEVSLLPQSCHCCEHDCDGKDHCANCHKKAGKHDDLDQKENGCRNNAHVYKLNDNYEGSRSIQIKPIVEYVSILLNVNELFNNQCKTVVDNRANSPPGVYDVPIYLNVSQFRL